MQCDSYWLHDIKVTEGELVAEISLINFDEPKDKYQHAKAHREGVTTPFFITTDLDQDDPLGAMAKAIAKYRKNLVEGKPLTAERED